MGAPALTLPLHCREGVRQDDQSSLTEIPVPVEKA